MVAEGDPLAADPEPPVEVATEEATPDITAAAPAEPPARPIPDEPVEG